MRVPIEFSRPSFVGLFYGSSKPQPDSLLKFLMDDLRFLHPCNRLDPECRNRNFSVRVRAVIADQKERAYLKG